MRAPAGPRDPPRRESAFDARVLDKRFCSGGVQGAHQSKECATMVKRNSTGIVPAESRCEVNTTTLPDDRIIPIAPMIDMLCTTHIPHEALSPD